jgi:uncharacterized membrane protein
MPNIGTLHPQVVHFVIALGLVGVLLRLLSLVFKSSWLSPAAATLIVLCAGAAVVAAKSGTDAHQAAERIPGAREAVQTHEQWGNRTRNVLLALAGLELLTGLVGTRRVGLPLRFLAAAGGLVAAFFIVKVADLGGDVVFEYAGGVGTRSGNPADVDQLLVAGLFYSARNARDSGRVEDAARLVDELARLRPGDTTVHFLAIESKLRDKKDAAGALTDLEQFQVAPDGRFAVRHDLLVAQALVASGRVDSARVILTGLAQRFPQSQGVKDALEKLR